MNLELLKQNIYWFSQFSGPPIPLLQCDIPLLLDDTLNET